MNERLINEGRLGEKEREAERLKLRIVGLRDSIRGLLDQFETIGDLKVDVAAEQALELASLHADYRAALDMIAAIKKALGK